MTDPQLNEPIELPLIQDAEAIPEDESVLVTLRALSDERRQVQILVPMTHEAADKLAGQLTAAAIQSHAVEAWLSMRLPTRMR